MGSNGRRHPFDVLEYEGERVEIDVEIAPLVEFDGPDAEKFINLVAARGREPHGQHLGPRPGGDGTPMTLRRTSASTLALPHRTDSPRRRRARVQRRGPVPRRDLPTLAARAREGARRQGMGCEPMRLAAGQSLPVDGRDLRAEAVHLVHVRRVDQAL